MPRKTWKPSAAASSSAGFNEAAARCRGKQGPFNRPFAGLRGFNEAAARCRGKRVAPARLRGRPGASMRPRPDAAENRSCSSPAPRACGCFNEAAARCRGKPGTRAGNGRAQRGFNEAAARCRGKRRVGARLRPAGGRFNEAAARCRGKHPDRGFGRRAGGGASMRPRPDAAENLLPAGVHAGRGVLQ